MTPASFSSVARKRAISFSVRRGGLKARDVHTAFDELALQTRYASSSWAIAGDRRASSRSVSIKADTVGIGSSGALDASATRYGGIPSCLFHPAVTRHADELATLTGVQCLHHRSRGDLLREQRRMLEVAGKEVAELLTIEFVHVEWIVMLVEVRIDSAVRCRDK